MNCLGFLWSSSYSASFSCSATFLHRRRWFFSPGRGHCGGSSFEQSLKLFCGGYSKEFFFFWGSFLNTARALSSSSWFSSCSRHRACFFFILLIFFWQGMCSCSGLVFFTAGFCAWDWFFSSRVPPLFGGDLLHTTRIFSWYSWSSSKCTWLSCSFSDRANFGVRRLIFYYFFLVFLIFFWYSGTFCVGAWFSRHCAFHMVLLASYYSHSQ